MITMMMMMMSVIVMMTIIRRMAKIRKVTLGMICPSVTAIKDHFHYQKRE